MDIQQITNYFQEYGSIIVFLVVLLEYLNLPGFPAGIVMPLTGVWAAKGDISLGTVLILSELAGLIGSWALYYVGRFGGDFALKKYLKRYPKHTASIENFMDRLQSKGYQKYVWLFIAKLMPMIRTLVSIPAGIFRMNILGYTVCSAIGVLVWNACLIGAGYFFGERILP